MMREREEERESESETGEGEGEADLCSHTKNVNAVVQSFWGGFQTVTGITTVAFYCSTFIEEY